MYAAPTAETDFSILSQFRKLNWKQQMAYLDQLNSQLQSYTHPQQIEICFLAMLQEKNINVLTKIFKLVKAYVCAFGISILSFREFVSCLLSFSSSQHIIIDEIIAYFIEKSVKLQSQVEELLKGVEDALNSGYNFESIIKILTKILNTKHNLKFIQSPLMEKVLSIGFANSSSDQTLSEAQHIFFQNIVQVFGQDSLLLARKCKLPANCLCYIKQLLASTQFTSQQRGERNSNILEVQLSYTYDLCSQDWLQDYKLLSVRNLCLSLKEAVTESSKNSEIKLTQKLIQSLLWLSHRKNKNINKFIFEFIGNSISRHSISSLANSDAFLQILFATLADKRVSKKLLEEQISVKEQLWLTLFSQQYIRSKIKSSHCQQEYHRLIMLIKIMKRKEILEVKNLCMELQEKENLSNVYRIQLEQITKQ